MSRISWAGEVERLPTIAEIAAKLAKPHQPNPSLTKAFNQGYSEKQERRNNAWNLGLVFEEDSE